MRRLAAALIGVGLLVAAGFGARLLWVAFHVGAGYTAEVACSLVLNSGQDAAQIFRDYISHEVNPTAGLLRVSVSRGGADASVLGLVHVRAVYRRGLGCTLLADGGEDHLALADGVAPRRVLDPGVPWPEGAAGVESAPLAAIAAAIDRAFREPGPAQPGHIRQTKAVVVAQNGRLIAERYARGTARRRRCCRGRWRRASLPRWSVWPSATGA